MVDLSVTGPIGSPLSPVRVQCAISRSSANNEDIFWNPGFIPAINTRLKSVVTVHDLTHLRFYSAKHRLYYDWVLKHLYRRCERIVCVSEYTKAEFCAWSRFPHSRVNVVYNGISERFLTNKVEADLGFPYVLYPGNYRPYKNLDRLFQAYSGSRLPGEGVKLVLTGSGSESLLATAKRLRISDHVVFAGFVPEERLAELYRGSLAVAFVSLYEGFGLPLLEAMASDVPAVTSNVSAMPEIAGDAAIIVDPYAADEIIHGLHEAVFNSERRHQISERAKERLRKFSWDSSAVKMANIFDDLSCLDVRAI
ncbi:glycosyltransferase family 4 protein [Pigmentiphaga litoralis]|uniref:glycosyltransferase family 4 protein n=1 Tax=Pigmentiphaga litoralis TaxID=516702 RepID=UPI003B429929